MAIAKKGLEKFDHNIYRGRRLSAARAYVHSIKNIRNNLTLKTRAFTTKILFEGKKAIGVEYQRYGITHKESIVVKLFVAEVQSTAPIIITFRDWQNADELNRII